MAYGCVYDGDCDPVDFQSEAWHTARKRHQCIECDDYIEPGEHYCVTSGRYDGWYFAHKRHDECQETYEFLSSLGYWWDCPAGMEAAWRHAWTGEE